MTIPIDIFLSYAREDQSLVQTLVDALGLEEWNVFWDVNIPAGATWTEEIDRKLLGAKCVLVLWTESSVCSAFVVYEASLAKYQRKLLQVKVAGCDVPGPFEGGQAVVLRFDGARPDQASIDALLRAVSERIDHRNPLVTLPAPRRFDRVTSEHLTLVHSSWRREDKDAEYGAAMYQIHVILLGQPGALDRVERVTYHLDPAYRASVYVQDNRSKNFGFYELANGYSMIHATVKVQNQTELVELSRFINLSETGPRLAMFFDRKPSGLEASGLEASGSEST